MAGRVVVFREIVDPNPGLLQWLDARDQALEVEDDQGKSRIFIENGIPRPSEITEMIVGREGGIDPTTGRRIAPILGCTKGFALFVEEDDGGFEGPIAYYAMEGRAQDEARKQNLSILEVAERDAAEAKVVVTASIEGVGQSGWGSLDGGEPVEDDGE